MIKSKDGNSASSLEQARMGLVPFFLGTKFETPAPQKTTKKKIKKENDNNPVMTTTMIRLLVPVSNLPRRPTEGGFDLSWCSLDTCDRYYGIPAVEARRFGSQDKGLASIQGKMAI